MEADGVGIELPQCSVGRNGIAENLFLDRGWDAGNGGCSFPEPNGTEGEAPLRRLCSVSQD